MRHLYPTLAAMLVVMTTLPARGQSDLKTYDLRPKFKEGQTARYSVWTLRVRNSTVTAAGRTQDSRLVFDINGEVSWRVDRVNSDGSAACTMTLDWLTVALTLPDGTKQFSDSRRGSGDNENIQALLKAMSGVPMAVTVQPDGSISRVEGGDVVRQRAGSEVEAPDDLDYVETASDLATLPFAPAQATVGQSWKADFRWTHDLGFMHHQTTFQLASVEEIAGIPVATVTGTARLSLEVDKAKQPPNAPPMTQTLLSGEATTQVMLDLSRREAVGRNTVQTTRIQTTMQLGEQSKQSVTQVIDETIQSQALRLAETSP